jgi:CBS domain containing-hemolysin-like protein
MISGVFLIGLVLAVFGATAGAALVSVSQLELARAVSRRLRGGPGSLSWLAEMDNYLGVTSTITALGVVLLGAATPAIFAGLRVGTLALVIVGIALPFVLLSGYVLPRWLARPRAEAVRSRVVPLLKPLAQLLGVFLPSRTVPGLADLRAVWRQGASAGLALDDELIMVGGVITFAERPVREVMTPRTEIVAIAEDAPLDEIASVFAQSGYSRLPVYRGTLDEIIGMLHAFDLLKLRPGAGLPVRPVANAPAGRTCGDLLLDMQRERRHLALVLDEFGGTLGLVTFEDLLEELVGEIFDEFDEGNQPAAGQTPVLFEADGATSIGAIEERFEHKLPVAKTSTVAGLLAELAGRIPLAGERFVVRELQFDVVQASPTRVERVIIRVTPPPPVTLAPPLAGDTSS